MCFSRGGERRRIGAILVGLAAAASAAAAPEAPPSGGPADRTAQVAKLIEQLGAEQYATREKAQADLGQLGLEAFDALYEAQFSDDIEIAFRARYLVESMQASWSRDSDPPDVKRILRHYDEQYAGRRAVLLERLASLSGRRGVEPLCRLTRFETDNTLSKRAALLIMSMDQPSVEAEKTRLAESILDSLGRSTRPAAHWLRTFARTLHDPESTLDEWQRLGQLEEQTLAQFPEDSNREIAFNLLRWQAELLLRLKHDDAAAAVVRRTVNLLDGSREKLLEAVDWLIRIQAWSVVEELASRYPEFQQDTLLLYRAAEVQLKQRRAALADQTASRAMKLLPDKPDSHLLAAYWLESRGLIDWSEREYRYVMQLGPLGSEADLMARFQLSEMLRDIDQPRQAADVLRPVVEAIDRDEKTLKILETRFLRTPAAVRSRMHFFYALHYASVGDQKKHIEHLEEGVKNDPYDADVLIAMHRAANTDEAWRKRTRQSIEAACTDFRKRMKHLQGVADHPPNEPERAEANRLLASANNQFAWLVANTVGDYDEALNCSRKSLELDPDRAGYLDTLGRCYYAKGDYANAVKHQSRAAELEPHSGQIRSQLELFQKALAESERKESGKKQVQPSAKAP